MRYILPKHPTGILILVIACIAVITSCDNPKELNRRKAKRLLIEYYDYPYVETSSWKKSGTYSEQTVNSDKYKTLIDGQVIEFTKRKGGKWGNYDRVFTEKGKEYVYKETDSYYFTASNQLEFGEVTGIQTYEIAKVAEVNFTLIRTNVTPFGKHDGREEDEVIEKTINFQLFDDGWRIDRDKPENIKPEQVPFFQ